MGKRRSARVLIAFAVVLLVAGCNGSAVQPPAGDWSQAPATPEERLCAQFIQRKNNSDPTALELLNPPPGVPDHPVSREEADRLDTEFFLRQDVHIAGVGRGPKAGQLVLCATGSVSAPPLPVQTASGVETHQRVLFNPDFTVEVRDGRVCGVSSGVHMGP